MCDERERLLSYLYDECEADERREVERHLETCATCRDEISGLQSVRQDLLAWEVPAHDSVWRPFVPARVTPWWRGVPAWAMAAAAGLVFLVGATGGVTAHALLAPVTLVRAPAPPAVVQAGVTPADLAALEQRLLLTMQTQLDQRVALVSSHGRTSSLTPDDVMRQLRQYMKMRDQQQQELVSVLRDLNNGLATMSRVTNNRLDTLNNRVTRVSALMAGQSR
jgi:Putative zinc-finger